MLPSPKKAFYLSDDTDMYVCIHVDLKSVSKALKLGLLQLQKLEN